MGHSLNNIPCNLAFEEFFKICMSGDKDGNLLIWKWKVNAFPIISIKIHKTVSKHINLIRNDNTIITGSWDGFLKGWEYY
jgi:WD40 repeat protein